MVSAWVYRATLEKEDGMDRLPKKADIPEGYDLEIETLMLELVMNGEAETVYDPVRRDLILLFADHPVTLYSNEQN